MIFCFPLFNPETNGRSENSRDLNHLTYHSDVAIVDPLFFHFLSVLELPEKNSKQLIVDQVISNRQFLLSYAARISSTCSEKCLKYLVIPFQLKDSWSFFILSDIHALRESSSNRMKVVLLKSPSLEALSNSMPSLQSMLDEVLGKILSLLRFIMENPVVAAHGEQVSKLRSHLEQPVDMNERVALSTAKLSHFDILSLQGFQALLVMERLLQTLRVSSVFSSTATPSYPLHCMLIRRTKTLNFPN